VKRERITQKTIIVSLFTFIHLFVTQKEALIEVPIEFDTLFTFIHLFVTQKEALIEVPIEFDTFLF